MINQQLMMALTTRALQRILITTMLLLTASNAFAAIDCTVQPWLAGNEVDLDEAIACFNAKTLTANYHISITQNINLTSSSTTINNSILGITLIIEGNDFTVDGQNNAGVRPFRVLGGTVTLQNVSIVGGRINGNGGGIHNSGELTLNNCTVSGNTVDFSTNKDGGGIYNQDRLTVNNCIISNNTADDVGGGFANTGTLTINNSTISNNSVSRGGGIDNTGTLTINNSTISDNVAGEGVGIIQRGGTLTINGSTISGNTSLAKYGGGIYLTSGTASINNSTLSGNFGGTGFMGNILGSNFTINNSILANPAGTRECTGFAVTGSYNLIESSTNNCGLTDGVDGNIIGQAPLLGTLQDNGGATFTHAVLAGSPALDSGDPAFPVGGFDQRGVGHDRIINGRLDIGAYEAAVYALNIVTAGSGNGLVSSNPAGINCGPDCSENYHDGTEVTVTVVADVSSSFTAWSGACTGAGSCVVTMDADRSVTANFTLNSYAITETASPIDGGSVTCTPNPVDHGGSTSCSATANTGYTFTEWSGDCAGQQCTFDNVSGAISVTAQFSPQLGNLMFQDGFEN